MANMPLTDIGITPRKASQFASKGIETVTDLLGYYPTKYLDFRNPISFAEGKYHQGEHVAIKGKVVSGRVIDGKHYMLRLTDGNTFCTVFWFNQPFRTRQFSVGDVIALGGVVSWNEQYNNMTMATPDFVTTDIASAFSIQPVYRKIKGMSVEYLEDAIKLAMPYTRECSAETLSLAQMRALRVPPIAEAIHMAHQPTDEKEIRLSRKRRAVDVLYPFCYELEAKKAEAAKVSFCRIKSTRDVLNKMQGVLPFKLTEDQKNAAEHMLTEMEHGERVDTLVQGDVGCGKTVVAEICALAMAMNGFQCAVMAPTVVLATQHYEEFSKILGSFGYKTVFLRSGMKAKEEKSVLEEIESGKAQIIVGTHSVISGKVKYHKLGLTIVDEEHRFGVEQREALKQKAKDGVHNVSMSATPIPRSLANTLYGEGTEIVNIHTMPAGRKPVKTIIWSNENSCYKSVYNQIKEGHQCYIVCPLIEDSDSETLEGVDSVETTYKKLTEWFKPYPEVTIKAISGDMKAKEVQEGIEAFAQNQANILISTTIVEVGVNVPNATVIVIKNAERFGLAQLHQLRGRVGRSSLQSYCVLLSKDKENERLKTMEATNDGFKIAEKDLELRGTGQILGVKQSGKDAVMPEDRRARDLAEMRRCVADNKHGPRRFLQGKVFGVRPVQNGSAVVEVSRGTLRVMIPAEDFFYFSLMKGIEENDATTRQRRYLRKAKLMNGAIINFCPYMEAKSEDGEVVFAGSRQDAMQLQRNRHFFGRNADVQNGSRAIASILSSGPDYVIAEALGVETSIGAGALSAYEYIDDVSKKFHVGEGIPVVIEDLNVDNENGTVSMRMNRAILERRANPAMNIHSLARNGAYGATVTSVQDNYYRLIVDVGNIQARVARTASDELLTRGDRVTLLVYGYDDKRNYVWGACHKA